MHQPELKIKISMGEGGTPAQRQLPNLQPRWENCTFYINQDIEECDAWIVWGNLYKEDSTKCPKNRTIFFAAEPPSVHKYNREFLKQFYTIVTSDKKTGHQNPIYSQQALPWWVGHKMNQTDTSAPLEHAYDELKQTTDIPKTKLISLITSNKTFTAGHKKRLALALKLKEHFDDKLDLFGGDFKPIDDKWDAIAPYKYHIAIENSSYEDYWSEKLTDSILAGAYTFYYGCPNLDKYFSNKIYSIINVDDPKSAIECIEHALQEELYLKSKMAIAEARKLILNKYQLFPTIYNLCSSITSSDKEVIILKPEKDFYKKPTLLSRIFHKFLLK